MNANRLRGWLGRQHVGGVKLRLTHDGAGERNEFQAWDIKTLLAMEEPEQAILEACKDLADSLEEAVRVAIQVIDEDGDVAATTYHKQTAEENAHHDGDNAANVSTNTIIAQLLRHIEMQQKVMTHSQGNIYAAFEKTLARLEKTNERQNAQIQALNETIQVLRQGASAAEDEPSPEEREEAIQRGMAWQKFGELAPVVLELAATYANAKMSNGHGANGHASAAAG